MWILAYNQVTSVRKTWKEIHTYDFFDCAPARSIAESSLQNVGANDYKLANLDVAASAFKLRCDRTYYRTNSGSDCHFNQFYF